MNDTREIMTLGDAELDFVSGGSFSAVGSFNNTLTQSIAQASSVSSSGHGVRVEQEASNFGFIISL
jgi:hypothetical protein